MYVLFSELISSSSLTMKASFSQVLVINTAPRIPSSLQEATQKGLNSDCKVKRKLGFLKGANPKLREIIAPYQKPIFDLERGEEELRGHVLCFWNGGRWKTLSKSPPAAAHGGSRRAKE